MTPRHTGISHRRDNPPQKKKQKTNICSLDKSIISCVCIRKKQFLKKKTQQYYYNFAEPRFTDETKIFFIIVFIESDAIVFVIPE